MSRQTQAFSKEKALKLKSNPVKLRHSLTTRSSWQAGALVMAKGRYAYANMKTDIIT